MWFLVLSCFTSAFVVSLAATRLMIDWAPRWGLVDRPAARKVHEHTTPLGGGIGIWLGVVVPLAAANLAVWGLSRLSSPPSWLPANLVVHLDGMLYRTPLLWAVVGAGTMLAAMGLLDDRRPIPWPPRLAVQLLVACGLVAIGVRATVFVPLPWVGMLLTVVWILTLVNAVNFLDNMDGLAGGIGLIASLLFAFVMLGSTSEPRWLVGGLLLVLAGSLAGFLWFNRSPARIFMGDCGSYFVGLLLATTTVLGTFYDPETGSRHVMLAPLCILAVPLFDLSTVVLIRLRKGLSPFRPDRNHFSHRLVALGLSRPNAVRTVHLVTLTTGLGALILYEVPGWTAAVLVLGMVACQLAIITILEWHGRHATEPAAGPIDATLLETPAYRDADATEVEDS